MLKINQLNKMVSVCFVAVLLLCGTIGGVLAMTASSADSADTAEPSDAIRLVMQQRDGNGDLVAYEDNKVLYPIVGELYTDEAKEMPDNVNFVDCIVSAKNSSDTNVYVRVLVAVPTALDVDAEGKGPLHMVDSKHVSDEEGVWSEPEIIEQGAEYDGVPCNIYIYEYKDKFVTEETAPVLLGMYLDSDVTNKNDDYIYNGKKIDYDFTEGVRIPIAVQAIQVDGWTDGNKGGSARDAAFANLYTNPWAGIANGEAETATLDLDVI